MENDRQERSRDWKLEALGIVSGLVSGIKNGIVEAVQERVEQTRITFIRKASMMGMMFMGVLFLLLGIAHLINSFFQTTDAVGYLVIGSIGVVGAAFMSLFKK